ncbi:MAG: ABC transporter permease [Oscillospiraceae bacterium]|nr:ABC transporter permease [Oscillospiraceae bacterium]
MNFNVIFNLMLTETGRSLFMTAFATIGAYLLGLPLGVLLSITDKDGIKPLSALNWLMGLFINIMRAVPFLILAVVVIPIPRFLIGTGLGYQAMTITLVIASFAFVARLVENSIKDVDKGVIEAAQSMGASTFQIIYKVLIPEAMPSLVLGAAIAATTILGFSAMAGILGGDGLGFVAITYGYFRWQRDIMWIAVALLIILVMIGQFAGNFIARKIDKR